MFDYIIDFLFNNKETLSMALTREEIVQIVQQVVQGTLEQSVQSAGQYQADKKVVGYEDMTHDIGVDEAMQNATLNDAQTWSFNKKMTAAIEQRAYLDDSAYAHALKTIELKERNLASAEREAKLRHQTKMESIELRASEQAEVTKQFANHLHLDFRAAVNESQLPLVDDDFTVAKLKGL